jgi:hypothetical protein
MASNIYMYSFYLGMMILSISKTGTPPKRIKQIQGQQSPVLRGLSVKKMVRVFAGMELLLPGRHFPDGLREIASSHPATPFESIAL